MDDLIPQHQDSLKSQFLQIPYIDHSILAASCKSAISGRCLSTGEFKMSLTHIADNLKLTFRIALIDHNPAIESADYE